MSDSSTAPNSFQFRGSSFDSMIETLGGAFGTFDAEPISQARDFRWGIDFSVSDSAV
jgi:hypothetical protein